MHVCAPKYGHWNLVLAFIVYIGVYLPVHEVSIRKPRGFTEKPHRKLDFGHSNVRRKGYFFVRASVVARVYQYAVLRLAFLWLLVGFQALATLF